MVNKIMEWEETARVNNVEAGVRDSTNEYVQLLCLSEVLRRRIDPGVPTASSRRRNAVEVGQGHLYLKFQTDRMKRA